MRLLSCFAAGVLGGSSAFVVWLVLYAAGYGTLGVLDDVLTLALVVITAFYAWATYWILRANEAVVAEMGAQSEGTFRPVISAWVHVPPNVNVFYLTVKNSGLSSATNLRLSLDKSFYRNLTLGEDNDLSRANAFAKCIPTFGPRESMTFLLGANFEILDEKNREIAPHQFTVTADYFFGSKRYTETTYIDLTVYIGASIPHDEAARQLKNIVDKLAKVSNELTLLRGVAARMLEPPKERDSS